jgi:hypothetical protein
LRILPSNPKQLIYRLFFLRIVLVPRATDLKTSAFKNLHFGDRKPVNVESMPRQLSFCQWNVKKLNFTVSKPRF